MPSPLRIPCISQGWISAGCHFLLQCRKVKSESEVTQSCPTLSDPMDCSLPGSSIHGIFQASPAAAAAAKSLQLCPTLCNPIDGSPPGSPVPGILQARILASPTNT